MPKITHEDERIIEILSMFATEVKTGRVREGEAIDKAACILTAYMEGMAKVSVDGSMAEELAHVLGDLLFECDGAFDTCKPSRHTYNLGLASLEKYQQSKVQP